MSSPDHFGDGWKLFVYRLRISIVCHLLRPAEWADKITRKFHIWVEDELDILTVQHLNIRNYVPARSREDIRSTHRGILARQDH